MVWVRLEEDIDENQKIAALDDHAFSVYVCGLAYCNRNLTDGFIPTNIGVTLRHCSGRIRSVIRTLVDGRLWEVRSGGWQVHDYLMYQPSRENVLAERAQKQAAGQAGGRASAQARAQAPAQAKSKPGPGTGTGSLLNAAAAAETPGHARARPRGGGGFQPLGAVLHNASRATTATAASNSNFIPDEDLLAEHQRRIEMERAHAH